MTSTQLLQEQLRSLLILRFWKRMGEQKLRTLLKEVTPLELLNGIKNEGEEFERALNLAIQEEELHRKNGARLIPYFSEDYPSHLKEIADFPLWISVRGTCCSLPRVALIGTRACSLYGLSQAREFGEQLARAGVIVVSGLARGIDTAAHEGAVACGKTIAVIGSGLGNLYPQENSRLAQKIEKEGAVISELPYLTPPEKFQFPRRNRIIAALSQAIILIEAPLKSGAMITMTLAKQQKKICFALPGRSDQPTFAGNHQLIKRGEATLIEKADEILTYFKISSLSKEKNSAEENTNSLSVGEKSLIEQMPAQEIGIESLIRLTKRSVIELNILLMSLVLKKRVLEFPGKIYKKV